MYTVWKFVARPCSHLGALTTSFQHDPKGSEKIHFLSDGPVTQYRNKTMFYVLACHLFEFYPKITAFTWNYHEGKGAPDGVGAVCKRTADKFVWLGTDVSSLESLSTILRENCPGIRIALLDDKAIQEMTAIIDSKSEQIVQFSGAMKVHQICRNVLLPKKILFKTVSCFCNNDFLCSHFKLGDMSYKLAGFKTNDIFSDSDTEESSHHRFSIGDFLLVKFSGKIKEYRYAAICSGTEDDDDLIKVKFLKLCGENGTVFIITDEESFLSKYDVILQLSVPEMISNGGRFFIYLNLLLVFVKNKMNFWVGFVYCHCLVSFSSLHGHY